ncbi:WGR domain-containing protein [Amorphus sp. MBR-141]
MSAAYLTRVDPAQNMARYYAMDIQPTLFGEWTVVREWGRIGSAGQMKETPYPTSADAELALKRLAATKARRGYRLLT